jgi:hypothetical protein
MKTLLITLTAALLMGCGSTSYTFKANEPFEYTLTLGDWSVSDKTDLLRLRVKDADSLKVVINGEVQTLDK